MNFHLQEGEPKQEPERELNKTPAGKPPRKPTHELSEVLTSEYGESLAGNVENLASDPCESRQGNRSPGRPESPACRPTSGSQNNTAAQKKGSSLHRRQLRRFLSNAVVEEKLDVGDEGEHPMAVAFLRIEVFEMEKIVSEVDLLFLKLRCTLEPSNCG